MGPLEREMARLHGQRKLDAMRRRAGQLRQRVVAAAVVGFVVLWAVVFVQMATGHDPALGSGAATVRSAAKEDAAADPERRRARAAVPPPAAEEAAIEAERFEAEQLELQQREAELAELEELEAIGTGQS